MRLLLKLLAVAVAVGLLGLGVTRVAPARAPIRLGTREGYWAAAAGVYKKHRIGGPRGALPYPLDGWFLYASDHMHGSDFYRVPEAEVVRDFPRDVGQLGGDDVFVSEWAETGFRNWEKTDPQRADVHLLLLHLRQARLDWWMRKDPKLVYIEIGRDVELGIALQRMHQFPLVQLAEWGYLSALVLFAAWPWLRNRGRWSGAVHAALLPPLLLLPYWLGYCTWTYCSAGPGGGVVYPSILEACKPLPWTEMDGKMIRNIPPLLAPLAGPLGPMLSTSGHRSAGPTAVAGLGLGLGVLVFVLGTVLRRVGRPAALG